MNFKLIRDFAERNNIIAGACNAAPLEQTAQCTSPFVPFVSENYEKRTNPAATLKGVQSIIVIGVGCTDVPKKAAYAEFFRRTKCGTAVLSSLGTANDYHIKVKNLLRSLVSEMKIHADFKYKILVDSASLDERALALRAGLGFFGRNGLIISKKFGSRFNIGCLLTTLPISNFPEKSSALSCPPSCNLCIKSCPKKSLCISYLTQKDELSPEESIQIGNQLYGCDICQDVCPFNAHMPKQSSFVNPQEWLAMSDDEFEKAYGHTAMLWRGTDILRRNANAVIENLYK